MKEFLEKNKKLILIALGSLIIILGLVFGGLYYYQMNRITTIITMDINPSIAISLNKNNVVLKVESLNEDAKEILKEKEFKGKNLETTISNISETLIEEGYITKEDNSILINVEGKKVEAKVTKTIENKVTKIVTDTLKEKEIEGNVIVQEVTVSSDKAEKYGISNSKASYIEEIIKENTDIKFEDLKDKTISEINNVIIEKEEQKRIEESKKVEEQKENEEQENEDDNHPPVQTYNPNNKYWTTAPSKDASIEEWCKFNKAPHPQTFSYNYEGTISGSDATNTFYNYLGLTTTLNRITVGTEDNRCTYCKAYIVKILTEDYKYTAVVDSVNKKIYDVQKEPVVLNLSKEDAINKMLNYFNVTMEDTTNAWAVLQFTNAPEGDIYCYNTNLQMKDGTDHIMTINAMTGEITWVVR